MILEIQKKLPETSRNNNPDFLYLTVTESHDTSIEEYGNTLDTHLKSIPEEPQIYGYTVYRRANSNSIFGMKNPLRFFSFSLDRLI